jgi:hypothetical protein
MRSAHGALYACQEGHNIGHLPTPGNSKTAGRRRTAANGRFIVMVSNKLRAR